MSISLNLAAGVFFAGLPLFCQGNQMLELAANQSLTVSYSNLVAGTQRFEFRIAGFAASTADQYMPYSNDIHCWIRANTLLLVCNGWDESTPNGIPHVDLTGRRDIRVRVQRDVANQLLSLEVWNGDGSGYAVSSLGITHLSTPADSGTITISTGRMSIGFFRWYTTCVALNSRPPADHPDMPGDRMNFLFAEGLSDALNGFSALINGPAGIQGNMLPACDSVVTAACLVPAPVNKPMAVLGKWGVLPYRTFSTSESLELDGSGSITSVGSGLPASYQWKQTGGPARGNISTPDSVRTQFFTSTPGTYTVELTVTDEAGNTGTASQTFGAVAVDSKGIVITDNAALDRLLGPQVMWGRSPWPYYDWGEMALALQIGEQGALLHAPTENAIPIAGTVAFTNGGSGSALTGTGTSFTTDLASSQCGGTPCTLYAAFPQDGRTIYVLLGSVASITSDTSATIHGPYYWNGPTGNVRIMRITDTSLLTSWGSTAASGNYNWNYYDPFVGIARLAVRTGLDQFWNDFDQLEAWWHDYGIAGGYNNPIPRVSSLFGVMVEALRGHPEMWKAVHWWLMNQYQAEQENSNGFANPSYDLREFSYIMLHAAGASLTDPDVARHADYCTVLNTWTDLLVASQNALGYWPQDIYEANPGYPFQKSVSFPWHMDITVAAMEKAYESYTDLIYGCSDRGRAAVLKTAVKSALDFMWIYGRNRVVRGPHYYVMSAVDGESRNGNGPGSIAWSGAGSIITGAGTNFTTATVTEDDGSRHSICDGSHYIALDSLHTVVRIGSCISDTQLTLAESLTGSAFSNGTYFLPALSVSGPACNSEAPVCGLWGQDEARIMVAGFGWWAANFGGSNADGVSYFSQADEWFSAAFGGPSDGPGGTSTYYGPNGNGYQSDWTYNLNPCSKATAPCTPTGQNGPTGAPLGKNWGQGSGAVGAQSWLAWRILAEEKNQQRRPRR